MSTSPLARHVIPCGAGAGTFISFHGITDSGAANPDLARRMSALFRVVLPDARGHGLSPDFTAEQLVDPFRTLVDDAEQLLVEETDGDGGAVPVILHGHSMGGATAAAVARRRPDLVTALILEDPALFTEPQRRRFATSPGDRIGCSLRARSDPGTALGQLREAFPGWPVADSAGWLLSQIQVREDFLSTGVADGGEPPETVLSALEVPTLLVTGDVDCLIGAEGLDRASLLGNRRLRSALIPGARHSVRRDRPDEFHSVISDFLDDVLDRH
ncbi:alpha/beta fold hydrolase [Corynebacterium pygosceleis]|uniref:Alpha/beta hydrolase n=1 Tax=Corynebacterium pygosceleis TaxID=2800406 RepID=A0A9Q4GL58_9CORY|nr:alpha/beta hydrolase [Corynebacterium pygosceleis]MCK7638161.1 alpha/beta hydrolase [Corynebacterium pygosceleis]MCK7675874.1 alpha/beta hydrolase [Corynebacterium pygosceleis]MCL0120744.1 alpha/beta hydrolase [Corynebacterium pygosceleis]MCX7444284.1 alpha/beta hydrolase [Corynebacterium pygosceleis]MCX7468877.1 alpha/beta hydrolase [Corynebacterium pygosceleis]